MHTTYLKMSHGLIVKLIEINRVHVRRARVARGEAREYARAVLSKMLSNITCISPWVRESDGI